MSRPTKKASEAEIEANLEGVPFTPEGSDSEGEGTLIDIMSERKRDDKKDQNSPNVDKSHGPNIPSHLSKFILSSSITSDPIPKTSNPPKNKPTTKTTRSTRQNPKDKMSPKDDNKSFRRKKRSKTNEKPEDRTHQAVQI
ncbi:Uncharacterised protein at_DN2566 [Pycnogonum litorale]